MITYSFRFLTISQEIDELMLWFSHTREDTGYSYKRRFDNQMRFDLYETKWRIILRVWRGAWLARQYPLVYDWFDEVMKVLAKLEIDDAHMLQDKHIIWIFELLDQAPRGIWAFD